MNIPRGTLMVSSLTLIGLIALGCGLGDKVSELVGEEAIEKAIELNGGGDVELDIGGSVDMADLPDYCQYPGAKATGKISTSTAEGSGAQYMLESSDPVATVVAWYKQQFAAWTNQLTIETPEGTQLVYNRTGTDDMVHVLVTQGDEGITNIMVSYANAPGAGAASGTSVQINTDGTNTSIKTGATKHRTGPRRGGKGRRH